MAGKKGGKKGPSAKQLEIIWRLRTLSSVFKAASAQNDVPLHQPLLDDIDEHVDAAKPLTKLVFQGAEINEKFVRAITDCLAGYPDVKNLCFWGCKVTDEGLMAISDVLRSSADTLWKGSKIKQIEVSYDGVGYPCELWHERHEAMVRGGTGLVTSNSGFQIPSWVLGTAPDVRRPIPEEHTTVHENERKAALMKQPDNPCNEDCTSSTSTPVFGAHALRYFALALGVRGTYVSVLVFDHNYLGDNGMRILSVGLDRSAALKRVSFAFCGIGEYGAKCFADTMVDKRQRPVLGEECLTPKYEFINLQGNPLGAQGLMYLSLGIKGCKSLNSLNLADVGVTSADTNALQEFANAVALNTSLIEVDFNFNHIGDRGARMFIPVLSVGKHIKALRITNRIDGEIAKQIFGFLKENNAKKKLARKGTKKKK